MWHRASRFWYLWHMASSCAIRPVDVWPIRFLEYVVYGWYMWYKAVDVWYLW